MLEVQAQLNYVLLGQDNLSSRFCRALVRVARQANEKRAYLGFGEEVVLSALRNAFYEATSVYNVCGCESDWSDAIERFCVSALFDEPVTRPTLPLKLQII